MLGIQSKRLYGGAMAAGKENGINIVDWNARVYRIFSKTRFLELLKTQQNGLVAPSMWDDPFENFFLKCVAVTGSGERVSLERLYKSWFGQCWTLMEESDAMWRIYSHDKTGVRVSTTIQRLFDSFYDAADRFAALKFFIGEVRYESRADIEAFLARTSFADIAFGGQAKPFAETLCIKREEFAHEGEIRLLFNDAENQHVAASVVPFRFDTAALIDSVVLDPRMPEADFQAARNEIQSYGYSGEVLQSELYKFSPPVIRIE
jgi:hypothetical protein